MYRKERQRRRLEVATNKGDLLSVVDFFLTKIILITVKSHRDRVPHAPRSPISRFVTGRRQKSSTGETQVGSGHDEHKRIRDQGWSDVGDGTSVYYKRSGPENLYS